MSLHIIFEDDFYKNFSKYKEEQKALLPLSKQRDRFIKEIDLVDNSEINKNIKESLENVALKIKEKDENTEVKLNRINNFIYNEISELKLFSKTPNTALVSK